LFSPNLVWKILSQELYQRGIKVQATCFQHHILPA
jgi:hypothetical protein